MFVWLSLDRSCFSNSCCWLFWGPDGFIAVLQVSFMGHLWWGSPSLYVDPLRLVSSGEALVIYDLQPSQGKIQPWRAAFGAKSANVRLLCFCFYIEFVNTWVRCWREHFKNGLLHQTLKYNIIAKQRWACKCIFESACKVLWWTVTGNRAEMFVGCFVMYKTIICGFVSG